MKRDAFILKKDWGPVDIFWNMFGRSNKAKSSSEMLGKFLNSTNDYIEEHWTEKSRRPPTRKVGGRPEGTRVGPLADGDDGYVKQAELVSFLGLNMLIGYHQLPEHWLYWSQEPDLGLGIVQQ